MDGWMDDNKTTMPILIPTPPASYPSSQPKRGDLREQKLIKRRLPNQAPSSAGLPPRSKQPGISHESWPVDMADTFLKKKSAKQSSRRRGGV